MTKYLLVVCTATLTCDSLEHAQQNINSGQSLLCCMSTRTFVEHNRNHTVHCKFCKLQTLDRSPREVTRAARAHASPPRRDTSRAYRLAFWHAHCFLLHRVCLVHARCDQDVGITIEVSGVQAQGRQGRRCPSVLSRWLHEGGQPALRWVQAGERSVLYARNLARIERSARHPPVHNPVHLRIWCVCSLTDSDSVTHHIP
jgi:hypothetical protein